GRGKAPGGGRGRPRGGGRRARSELPAARSGRAAPAAAQQQLGGGGSAGHFLCAAPGQCEPELQQWRQQPSALAASVSGSLDQVPGVAAQAWTPVAQAWQAAPPAFQGRPVGLGDVAGFMREVLSSDPFGTGQGQPYVRFSKPGPKSEPKVVAVTQRQLAFLVANVLMGNDISSGNGLTTTLSRCASKGATGYLYSLLSLLAVLSQELSGGQQGKMLVGATPRDKDDSWKLRLENYLSAPETCVSQGEGSSCPDFMAGGTQGQALTDIAGDVVGGGGGLCDLANSQDESLMIFYPEVLAYVFFAGPGDFVPVPWTLLGARRYLNDLVGNSERKPGPTENKCGWVREQDDWLNQGIPSAEVQVPLNGGTVSVPASAFVAVASKSSQAVGGCPLQQAVNNNCDSQRHHVDEDLALWYQAFEPSIRRRARGGPGRLLQCHLACGHRALGRGGLVRRQPAVFPRGLAGYCAPRWGRLGLLRVRPLLREPWQSVLRARRRRLRGVHRELWGAERQRRPLWQRQHAGHDLEVHRQDGQGAVPWPCQCGRAAFPGVRLAGAVAAHCRRDGRARPGRGGGCRAGCRAGVAAVAAAAGAADAGAAVANRGAGADPARRPGHGRRSVAGGGQPAAPNGPDAATADSDARARGGGASREVFALPLVRQGDLLQDAPVSRGLFCVVGAEAPALHTLFGAGRSVSACPSAQDEAMRLADVTSPTLRYSSARAA
ncbi:unnamed protein product, partial [Prorocentrum cordatum]